MQDTGYEHAHSSPIKTWQQLAVVVALAFLIPVIGIILLTQLITSDKRADPATLSPEAVAARIQPVARVAFGDAAAPAGALKSGEETYKTVCAACHAQGIAGAPKIGDKAAWAPHIKEGLATLAKNAINGIQSPKGVMPPRGGNPTLSDWEVTAAVVHIANQSGASFKEPPRSPRHRPRLRRRRRSPRQLRLRQRRRARASRGTGCGRWRRAAAEERLPRLPRDRQEGARALLQGSGREVRRRQGRGRRCSRRK